MNWTNLISIILTSGVISLLGTVLTLWLYRPRVSAETLKIHAEEQKTRIDTSLQSSHQAAEEWRVLAEQLKRDNEESRARITELEQREAQWDQERDNMRSHIARAERAITALRYLIREVENQYPTAVLIALEIAEGGHSSAEAVSSSPSPEERR